jgi:hypothetical protein
MITTRTLSLYGPRPRPDAKAARAVLELLEDSGWLRAESSPARQKPRFRMHPKFMLSQMNQQHR